MLSDSQRSFAPELSVGRLITGDGGRSRERNFRGNNQSMSCSIYLSIYLPRMKPPSINKCDGVREVVVLLHRCFGWLSSVGSGRAGIK